MDEDIVKNIKNISINDKITQIYYPNCFKHFWENDKNYLFLKKYYNIHLPSFFFSSSQKCLDRILKHKSLAIIIANFAQLIIFVFQFKKSFLHIKSFISGYRYFFIKYFRTR